MGCFRAEIEVKPGYQATTFELEIKVSELEDKVTEEKKHREKYEKQYLKTAKELSYLK